MMQKMPKHFFHSCLTVKCVSNPHFTLVVTGHLSPFCLAGNPQLCSKYLHKNLRISLTHLFIALSKAQYSTKLTFDWGSHATSQPSDDLIHLSRSHILSFTANKTTYKLYKMGYSMKIMFSLIVLYIHDYFSLNFRSYLLKFSNLKIH